MNNISNYPQTDMYMRNKEKLFVHLNHTAYIHKAHLNGKIREEKDGKVKKIEKVFTN